MKLADFGIAKVLHGPMTTLTTAGQVIGTPRYMSPEQVRGERATARSDLYAVAVVLFEMLTGRAPFEYDSPIAVAMAHKDEHPPSLAMLRPDLDPRLVVLLHRTLGKWPDLRPTSAKAMRAALLATTGPPRPNGDLEPHAMHPHGWSSPTDRRHAASTPRVFRQRRRRNKTVRTVVAIAIALLTALIVGFIVQMLI